MENRDMIKAVMIGHAVADALGVPVEFRSRTSFAKDPVTDMRGYGTYPFPAGTWSDDTSMSVAALDSLASGEINYEEIMKNFADWYRSGKYTATGVMFDIGITCRQAISSFVNEDKSPLACGLSDMYSNGNGSLMRIHPFVLMGYFCDMNGEMDAVMENASSLTHSHERSVLACKIYARVLCRLLEDSSKESVLRALDEAKTLYAGDSECGTYARLFTEGFANLPSEEIRSSGYVVDTLEAAIWCLLTTDSYEACALKAVNLGEDTDTVAAVAGGLAGALYGYEAIPEKWRKTLLKRRDISL